MPDTEDESFRWRPRRFLGESERSFELRVLASALRVAQESQKRAELK